MLVFKSTAKSKEQKTLAAFYNGVKCFDSKIQGLKGFGDQELQKFFDDEQKKI